MAMGHGMDGLLDGEARLKIYDVRRLSEDGAHHFAGLYDFQIVEAQPVPGGRDELVIGCMDGRGEDSGEPLFARPALAREDLKLVHALLIVVKAALRSKDLEHNAALASPCGA